MRIFIRLFLSLALSVAAAAAFAAAQTAAPIPRAKPEPPPAFLRDGRAAALAEAFSHAEHGRLERARAAMPPLRDAPPETATLLAELLDWTAYVNGADSSFRTLRDLYLRHAEWPRAATVRRRVEEAMTTATPEPAILAWFEAHPPITARGRIRFAEALFAEGRTAQAVSWLREGWRRTRLLVSEERRILRRYGKHLSTADHIARTDYLLWARARADAHRMLSRLPPDYRALARARIALIGFAWNVDARVAAVPEHLEDNAGLVYDRVYWRRVKGKHAAARELLLSAEVAGEEILRPDRWWRERHFQARRALRRGEVETAYRLAAEHGLLDGHRERLGEELNGAETAGSEADWDLASELPRGLRAEIAEAEWLAGWIALRFLGRPVAAMRHFETMYAVVNFPVSLARGAYWAGRAAEALRDPALARRWFGEAARYRTAYYGQLALDRLGEDFAVDEPAETIDPALRERFERRPLVKAARLLAAIGADQPLRDIVRHLALEARSASQKALTAALGAELDRPDVGVIAAKLAERDGIMLVDPGYPVIDTPERIDGARALVHAIARQESLFDPQAVSHVGALGLMQLMPATARRVARQIRYPYSRQRLLNDPAYNLELGSHFFESLLDRYGGSPTLALAAYNAGPGSVDRWLDTYGDPRAVGRDPIDWIELIPYSETRNYVQRVLEAAVVYDVRFGNGGKTGLAAYLDRGRQPGPRDLRPRPRPLTLPGG